MVRLAERTRTRPSKSRRPLGLALVAVACLWAVGAVLPGARAGLAQLAPAVTGALPYAAQGSAVPVVDGLVLVAPRSGRFFPAVPDGARVSAGAALGEVDDWRAPKLAAQAASAARAVSTGDGLPGLLAGRAAAARALAAAARAALPAPEAGTVRWLLPGVGPAGLLVVTREASPRPGDLVQAGQPLGVLLRAGRSAWLFTARDGQLAGLSDGARAELLPEGAAGRVAAVGGGRAEVVAIGSGSGAPAAVGGRPVASTLAWGAAGGVLVPAGAVVWRSGAAWVLAAGRWGGRLRWTRVTVLSRLGGRAAVAGLVPDGWVAARPWLGGLWAAWP